MSEGANVLHFCHRLVGADGDRQKRLDDSSPRGRADEYHAVTAAVRLSPWH